MSSVLPKQIIRLDDKHVFRSGEKSLPFAPGVTLFDQFEAIPQHFMEVSRSLEQLEYIIDRIETLPEHVLFAGCQHDAHFIQVGVIGKENYPKPNSLNQVSYCKDNKIVYGRRWLIESNTPTSEVIQTAFLAIQKAREHELREHIKIRLIGCECKATPFSSHMDLPLMSIVRAKLDQPVQLPPESLLNHFQLLDVSIKIEHSTKLEENKQFTVVSIHSGPKTRKVFPELDKQIVGLVWDSDYTQSFLSALVEQLIALSNRHVGETFSYEGFKRFSHRLNTLAAADFSYQSRRTKDQRLDANNQYFQQAFAEMTHRVDSAKAPHYNNGKLGVKQRQRLDESDVTLGYLPK